MVKSSAERQKTYEEKRKAAGWKRVAVWIPEEKVAQLKQYVTRLQKQ